jgi:hypothetical protein
MNVKLVRLLAGGLLLLVWSHPVLAQAPKPDLSLKVIQARRSNAALMHQFTWNCRTELVDRGKVRDIRIDLVQYGPDGGLQRTLLNNQGSHLPRGFLRRAIAQGKKKQVEEFLTGLRGVLDQYTLPTQSKVIDFIGTADLQFAQAPDGKTLLKISGNNVVVPGDALTIWVDASTYATRRVQITTTYQGDEAQVTATYKTLAASGLTYLSMAEVEVPAKEMSLQVQNYDYEQSD